MTVRDGGDRTSHEVGDHRADPCYIVETASGEMVGHSGRKKLAEGVAEDRDEDKPEDAPHSVKKTSFNEVHERRDW